MMNYFFRFEHQIVLLILLGILIAVLVVRTYCYKQPRFVFSLGNVLMQRGATLSYGWHKRVLFIIRALVVLLLALLAAKPQWVDSRSQVSVDGIDIVLALDVSGSMAVQYGPHDNRSRFQVAQEEAYRFIQKRTQDAIGIVLFATQAISRCPITMDKKVLQTIIKNLHLGEVDTNSTMLGLGIVTAVNRLKVSKSKNRVMILLTDGEPSEKDISMDAAIEVAKKMGVKIYVIGIGNENEDMVVQNFFQRLIIPRLNKALLEKIADQTGGRAFMAHDANDMRAIYDTIDKLETVKHDAPIFSTYHDMYVPGLFVALVLFALEIIVSTFVWFGL